MILPYVRVSPQILPLVALVPHFLHSEPLEPQDTMPSQWAFYPCNWGDTTRFSFIVEIGPRNIWPRRADPTKEYLMGPQMNRMIRELGIPLEASLQKTLWEPLVHHNLLQRDAPIVHHEITLRDSGRDSKHLLELRVQSLLSFLPYIHRYSSRTAFPVDELLRKVAK